MLVKFEFYRDRRWWGAQAVGHAIFTQGRSFAELRNNIREAAHLHFGHRTGLRMTRARELSHL